MSALMARVARLDLDRVYFGLDDKPLEQVASGDLVFGDPALAAALPAGAVYVGADCDLPGGRYRWDGASFQPLPPSLQKKSEGAPDLERAFYELNKAGYAAGGQLPKAVTDWCLAYERSFDAALPGRMDAGPLGRLDYFRQALAAPEEK